MRRLIDDAACRWHSGRKLVERSERLVRRVEMTLTRAEIRLVSGTPPFMSSTSRSADPEPFRRFDEDRRMR